MHHVPGGPSPAMSFSKCDFTRLNLLGGLSWALGLAMGTSTRGPDPQTRGPRVWADPERMEREGTRSGSGYNGKKEVV